MASHAVQVLLEHAKDDDSGQIRARFRLTCGCELEKDLPSERFCETTAGILLLVGKYACPVGHPVRRPD